MIISLREWAGPATNHIAKYVDPDHVLEFVNSCDSQAAINTYRKLMTLNRMQLPNLPNSDVWQIIKWYKGDWGSIKMNYVPSHMDDYVEDVLHT